MRSWRWLLGLLALPALLLLAPRLPAPGAELTLELDEPDGGRAIAMALLPAGRRITLQWTNSLFGLPVSEVFEARGGRLILISITFADPSGGAPPEVRPEDVADLYHTGGAFAAHGLSRPVEEVIFRVGQLGRPVLQLPGREVRLLDEVGFGGRVRLRARPASLRDWLAVRVS